MSNNFALKISKTLSLKENQVETTLQLLEAGATVPFISRYRKERTGSLDEVEIANIRDLFLKFTELEKRREFILNSISEQDLLTADLQQQIVTAELIADLEDLYLPFKPKRRTKAKIAREKGLEPLAKIVMAQNNHAINIRPFVNSSLGVPDEKTAIEGAKDIIAEWINESLFARTRLRNLFQRESFIFSKVVKSKTEEAQKYSAWFDWSEKASKIPSHRALALFRGENEGLLRVTIAPEKEDAISILTKIFVKNSNESSNYVSEAINDSYVRLLAPSLVTEIRSEIKERADRKAIDVFSKNLRQLLMSPPVRQKNVLAIDPGFRTGCKIVCLDKSGKLLHNETIFPHAPQRLEKPAFHKLKSLVNAYKIDAIAIGNGTAGRETEDFVRRVRFDRDLVAIMVNENGASVYSASSIAREEFPEYDVTVRGAISIGRRLQDPLAELVKIDPKAIGVGQYQHDVNQKMLQKGLMEVVESCVNAVGADLNSASGELLSFISGIGPTLAKSIVKYRDSKGSFLSRNDLKKVPRFGEKAFEQSAGFLRISGAKNPLDNSAVHPESYGVVKNIASKLKKDVQEIIGDKSLKSKIVLEDFVTNSIGLPTLNDILSELEKPGRDPRKAFTAFEFDKNIRKIEDLKVGMTLSGIVNNVTAFGAFVDIGVHQSGLIHVSQMADRFISDPNEIVSLNQQVRVRVLEVDIARKRIQLSMKALEEKM